MFLPYEYVGCIYAEAVGCIYAELGACPGVGSFPKLPGGPRSRPLAPPTPTHHPGPPPKPSGILNQAGPAQDPVRPRTRLLT